MITRTGITVIAAALLIVLTAVAGEARRPHGNGDVGRILARAGRLYEQGDLERALAAVGRAGDLIASELGPAWGGAPYRSNAVELLGYLDLYRAYALGTDPEVDDQWARLTDMLIMVADIESCVEVPRTWRGRSVSSWSDGRVHRVGDLHISHWSDGSIHRIGDLNVSYWGDGRPLRIGGIHYSYSGSERRPQRVAGVETR